MSSLARRIVIAATLSTAGAVAVAGASMWLTMRATLLHTLDSELNERTQRMTQRGAWMLRPGGGWRRFVPSEYQAEGGTWFMQVMEASTGTELHRSPSLLEGQQLTALAPDPLDGTAITTRLADGRRVRLLAVNIAPPANLQSPPGNEHDRPPVPAKVYLAASTGTIDGQLHDLIVVLLGTWIVATGLAGAVSSWLSRTVLRPVRDLSSAITSAEPTRPGARIDLVDGPRELQPVVERLNELFARVEAAFQRERTTIADIAHELRTPVTVLRTTLEFSLAREHLPHSRDVQERCLRTAVHLQGLIGSLLMLARLEAGQEPLTAAPCDAARILDDCWEPLRERATARSMPLAWNVPAALPITTAADKLQIILSNLLDNAVSHGIDGGALTVDASASDGRMRIAVTNATGDQAIDADAIFTPFWRGDASRTGTAHSGLGLALARRIAKLLNGTLQAAWHERRFTITLDLPLAPAAAGPSHGSVISPG